MEEELYWLDIYQKYSSEVSDSPFSRWYQYIVRINYPVFHPAVFPGQRHFVNGGLNVSNSGLIVAKDEKDAIEQFTNIKEHACKNPANIDASVLYIKDNREFWRRNNVLLETYKHDCRICWKPHSDGEPLIYACHVLHKNCINDKCHTCHESLML